MEMIVTRVQRDSQDPRFIVLRVPRELVWHANIDPLAEVAMRVQGNQLIVESVQGDTEEMDARAEAFVARYRGPIRALADPEREETEEEAGHTRAD